MPEPERTGHSGVASTLDVYYAGEAKHLNSVKIDSLFPWIGGISVFPSFSAVVTPVARTISSGGHTSGVAARLIQDENCQGARSAPERRCF